jgi:hypothetical protein
MSKSIWRRLAACSLFALGCASPVTWNSGPLLVGGCEFAKAGDARWKFAGRVLLDAPPEEVFPFITDPYVWSARKSTRTQTIVDNSCSQSGPNALGVGSIITETRGEKRSTMTVTVFQPNCLCAFEGVIVEGEKKLQAGVIFSMHPSAEGGTDLTVRKFATPDNPPAMESLVLSINQFGLNRVLKNTTKRFGGKRVAVE